MKRTLKHCFAIVKHCFIPKKRCFTRDFRATLLGDRFLACRYQPGGRMNRLAVLVLSAAIAGCATRQEAPSAEAMQPLVCKDKGQCDLYWARAQGWVASNSSYRIQTVSDTLIVTYGPFGGKTDLAYQIVRVPNADGSARLTIRPACDNMFGCRPSPADAAVSFKRYVRG